MSGLGIWDMKSSSKFHMIVLAVNMSQPFHTKRSLWLRNTRVCCKLNEEKLSLSWQGTSNSEDFGLNPLTSEQHQKRNQGPFPTRVQGNRSTQALCLSMSLPTPSVPCSGNLLSGLTPCTKYRTLFLTHYFWIHTDFFLPCLCLRFSYSSFILMFSFILKFNTFHIVMQWNKSQSF